MATCQDLVDAVTALNSTIQDVRDNYLTVHDSIAGVDVSLAGLLLRIERDLREEYTDPDTGLTKLFKVNRQLFNIQQILETRLTARAFDVEFATRLIEVLQYGADSIAERIAQDTQIQTGTDEIAETGISDTVALDIAADTPTAGIIP